MRLILSSQQQQEDFRKLKKFVVESTIDRSRAVSYAQYYEEKQEQGRIETWQTTPRKQHWDHSTVQLPEYLKQASSNIGSEKDVVKPFWESVLGQHKLLNGWNNGYEIAHLGTKIPAISFFSLDIAKPSAAEFVAVGDCKGSSWLGTSSSEKGQILHYVHRMLDAQPERQFSYGFLTNNKIVVLVKGYRSSESPFLVRWCISNVLTFEYGMKLWQQLMIEDSGYVPPPIFDGYSITFRKILRPEGTCRAFGATYRGEAVVAKLYNNDAIAADNTCRTTKAANAVSNATRSNTTILATLPNVVITKGKWCLMKPQGTPLSIPLLTKIHIKRLVHTLQVIHAKGIIHRDVRVSNIFHLSAEEVLLNDWRLSVEANQGSTLYAGAPEPHIHPRIPLHDFYQPSAQHDLYSLVSSVAQLLLSGANTESRKQFFEKAFQAADVCDYNGVCQHIQRHMR